MVSSRHTSLSRTTTVISPIDTSFEMGSRQHIAVLMNQLNGRSSNAHFDYENWGHRFIVAWVRYSLLHLFLISNFLSFL